MVSGLSGAFHGGRVTPRNEELGNLGVAIANFRLVLAQVPGVREGQRRAGGVRVRTSSVKLLLASRATAHRVAHESHVEK